MCLPAKVLFRHSEALAEESQGLDARTTRVPRHPEFISGSYRFGVGLQAGKMLKQVQHDREPFPLLLGEGKTNLPTPIGGL